MMIKNETYAKLTTNSDAPADKVLSHVSVLFADDSPDTLALMQFKAMELGWNFTSVSTASDILNEINKTLDPGIRPYDAVISDINFKQDVTGITAARAIRKAQIDIPIIFVSGYANSMNREEARRVNAQLIRKADLSVDIDELFVRIAQAIYWYKLATIQSPVGPNLKDEKLQIPPAVVDALQENIK